MFPTTCSYRPSGSRLTVGSLSKSDIDVIEGSDDIPSILHDQWGGYRRFVHKFPVIRHKIALMTDDAKDELAKKHKHSGKILQQVNTVSPQFKTALAIAIDTHDLRSRRKLIDGLISGWQKKYDLLVTPGVDLAAYIDYDRHQLSKLRIGLVEARESTAGARQDVMNKWPLAKRITQDVGLCDFDKHVNYDYKYALEVLDPWIRETISLENSLTLAWTNITAIHQNITSQIVISFSVDAQSHFGPDASRDLPPLQSWIAEVRQGGLRRIGEENRGNVFQDFNSFLGSLLN
ncbi:MAG: hypothetical protein Q9213_004977 [Squamulea squamosa]